MKPWSCLAVAFVLSACSYGFQGTGNPWSNYGVEKVYVKALTNNTLRPGVEVPFTSALIQEFARAKRLRAVAREQDADAIIEGSVEAAGSTIGPMATVPQTSRDPEAQKLANVLIASEYTASATIQVRLVKISDKKVLWSQSFNRAKTYPANNRFGLQGTTSALINASQEQLALTEIAEFLASDAYDTMIEGF